MRKRLDRLERVIQGSGRSIEREELKRVRDRDEDWKERKERELQGNSKSVQNKEE